LNQSVTTQRDTEISHKKGSGNIPSEKWMKPIFNFNTINYKTKNND